MHSKIYAIAIATLVASTAINSSQEQIKVVFNQTLISCMDGYSFAINGESLILITKMIRDIKNIQIGQLSANKTRLGMYEFEGSLHSTRSLASVEKDIDAEILALEEHKTKTHPTMVNKLEVLKQRKLDLQEVLTQMRKDFHAITGPFMEDARSTKSSLVVLIEDFCKQRNKPKSMLLDWAKCKEDEVGHFNKQAHTFALFDEFCTDLTIFMSDLMRNCPKAQAQFKKIIADYNKK